jgi:dipeptidyl aminopeptidase/acylaminoacyl peptidase
MARLTTGGNNYGPMAVSPDGTAMVFSGERNGKRGLFVMPLGGGEASLLREMPVDAESLRWTKGGIFFTAMVLPECGADLECTKKTLDDRKKGPSARVFDQLLHRPWNIWRDGTYSNLFVMDAEGKRIDPVVVGPLDIPSVPLGNGGLTVSEDGKVVVYSVKLEPDPARSTNYNLYETMRGPDGRFATIRRLTGNPGADESPSLSPDGTRIAYLSQDTPGFESDQWRLRIMDRKSGEIITLCEKMDRWVTAFDWAPDGKRLFFVEESEGYRPLQSVDAKKGADPEEEAPRTYVRMLASSKKNLWYTRESMTTPPELYVMDIKSGSHKRVAGFNSDVIGSALFGRLEEIWTEGSKGPDGKPRKIHSFLVMPPIITEGKKPPVVVVIHGGPQGSSSDMFHPRWNTMALASMGFAVVEIDFTGSTGYGQEFTNAISKDWGGAPYEDIMKLMDYLEKDPRVDAKNACAIGGSYGGYMTNWIEGHTDRFKCLVSHASVFNLTSKYGTTDELWFPEWEFGGTPWTNPDTYAKWSPHNYVKNFKTPIMVIHGQNDFRVPLEQGLGMYQYAKSMGVEAKLVYFPDEDHFVNRPKNRKFWYDTVGEWLKRHLGM